MFAIGTGLLSRNRSVSCCQVRWRPFELHCAWTCHIEEDGRKLFGSSLVWGKVKLCSVANSQFVNDPRNCRGPRSSVCTESRIELDIEIVFARCRRRGQIISGVENVEVSCINQSRKTEIARIIDGDLQSVSPTVTAAGSRGLPVCPPEQSRKRRQPHCSGFQVQELLSPKSSHLR